MCKKQTHFHELIKKSDAKPSIVRKSRENVIIFQPFF